jgi:hypothetical protein
MQEPDGVMIRAAEVRRLTGWNKKHIRKLRVCGIIKVWQPFANGWPWYYRDQILNLIGGSNPERTHR